MNNNVQTLLDFGYWKGRESEPGTSTLDSGDNLVDIVANDTEPDVLGILFYHPSKRSLGSLSHHVCFIEDDELEALREEGSRLGELLDLLANDVDTAVVRGVELGNEMRPGNWIRRS